MKAFDRRGRFLGLLCLLTAVCITVIGLVFLWSIGGAYGMPDHVKKQAIWSLVGIVLFFVVRAIDYRAVLKVADVIYVVVLGLLVLVLVAGRSAGGARRWLALGPVSVQPSEFAKLAVVLILAKYLSLTESFRRLRWIWVPFVIGLIPMMLILRQPDLGTASVLLPVLGAMLYVGGVRARTFLLVALLFAAALPLLWRYMASYQKERVIAFLSQDAPTDRQKETILYQLMQSKIAIGSGGLLGKGLGKGTQNTLGFLPNRETDFPFPVICEEWGFAGALVLFGLYFVLLLLCTVIAGRSPEPQGAYVVVGIMATLATHIIVNTGMTSGQLPVVGITLPFVSYGGSSLLVNFVGLGLVASVASRRAGWRR